MFINGLAYPAIVSWEGKPLQMHKEYK